METIPYNPLLEVTDDELKLVRKFYNIEDINAINEGLDALTEWISKQDHLAEAGQHIDHGMLERLLVIAKGSVEGTKLKIDKLLTTRGMMPDLSLNKNFDEFEDLLQCLIHVALPKLNPNDQSRVMVTQLLKDKWENFSLLSYMRFTFLDDENQKDLITLCRVMIRCLSSHPAIRKVNTGLVAELLDCKAVGEYRLCNDYSMADRYVVDLKHFNINILTRLNPILLKKAELLSSEGFGTKIKGIHLLNAPPFVDKIVFILKQGLKEKVASRLHVHNTYEEFHKEVPKEILPKDFDGHGPSLSKLAEQWKDTLKSDKARNICNIFNQLITDESKRSEVKFNEEYLGMPGSFRKLAVD